jgi:hypothetical protein
VPLWAVLCADQRADRSHPRTHVNKDVCGASGKRPPSCIAVTLLLAKAKCFIICGLVVGDEETDLMTMARMSLGSLLVAAVAFAQTSCPPHPTSCPLQQPQWVVQGDASLFSSVRDTHPPTHTMHTHAWPQLHDQTAHPVCLSHPLFSRLGDN